MGFPRLVKDHQKFLKSADKHLGKLTFKIILLHRNLNFWNIINRKKMHQSIDSYFRFAPCMSKLNPKKIWILLTTLGITIMFDFLIKVNIKKIKNWKNNFCPKGGLIQGPLDLKSTALSTHLSYHYIEFGKKIML